MVGLPWAVCRDGQELAIATSRLVEPGETSPDFVLPRGTDGGLVRFVSQVGARPAVVVLGGDDPDAAVRLGAALSDREVDTHVVVRSADHVGARTWLDEGGHVHDAFGVDAATGPVVVVLDRDVRVLAVGPAGDTDRAVTTVAGVVAASAAATPRGHAPVLVLPEAIRPAMAERVVRAWSEADPVPTGVETTADGRRVEALDQLRKRRRDHVVTEPGLLRDLTQHVGRRIVPQVAKAFAFTATGFEGFKVGAYDAEQDGEVAGFFDAHRDNLSPATEHRRFALSLVLEDDYEGGEVVFPEYGGDGYRLAAREALVFSGSLLHAVRPVTAGRRLVLLSFLFGAQRPATTDPHAGHDHD